MSEFYNRNNDLTDSDLIKSFYKLDLSFNLNEIEIVKKKLSLSNINEDDKFKQQLVQLRKTAIASNSLDDYINIFYDCWDLMSSEDAEVLFNYKLPPKFPTPTTNALVEFIYPIFKMKEHYYGNGSHYVGSGGSLVIAGPKGIGKTTLLMVIHTLIAILTEHVISFYWNYEIGESFPTPFELLQYHTNDLDENIVVKINRSKKMVVVLADEVQCLYVNREDSDYGSDIYKRKREIISQLAIIGKSVYMVGYISGSSNNTVEYCLHPRDNNLSDYTSLNNSVYRCYYVNPIRDKDTFVNLAKICLKSTNIPDNVLCYLFNMSGGVGRYLENISKSSFDININVYPSLPDICRKDYALYHIIQEIVLNIYDELRLFNKKNNVMSCFNFWNINHSISKLRVYQIIEVHHGNSLKSKKLSLYVDSSILFVNGGRVELLFPSYFFSLYYEIESFQKFEIAAMEGTLIGWIDSSNQTYPSPGYAIERPILKQIITNQKKYFEYCKHETQFIYLDRTELINSGSKIYPNEVNLQLLQGVSNFTGLDGFIFVTNDNKTIELYLIQIKTGRLESYIDQVNFNTWFRKAEVDIAKLMKLVKLNKKQNIIVKEYLLVTSKKIKDADIDWLRQPNRMSYKGINIPITVIGQNYFIDDLEDHTLSSRLLNWLK